MEAEKEDVEKWYGIKCMLRVLRFDWNLKTEFLHDAVVHMSAPAPGKPSMLSYANLLIELCGKKEAFNPQNRRHTRCKDMVGVQKSLEKGKKGSFGPLNPPKKGGGPTKRVMLLERLPRIMQTLVVELRRTQESDEVDAYKPEEGFDEDNGAQADKKPKLLSLKRREHGEMPLEATATWSLYNVVVVVVVVGMRA